MTLRDSAGAGADIAFVHVPGTGGRPFTFGDGARTRSIDVPDFYIAAVPTPQGFWAHVGGDNPSCGRGERRPVENISWTALTGRDGFLARLNGSAVRAELARQAGLPAAVLRLPSEAEWEYAARGGPHWSHRFLFSGGNDLDAVAWYQDNSGNRTHDVAQKRANQLGIHDMSGNVWEWCHDAFTPDVDAIPADGKPFAGASGARVLRGGCFHNWPVHCTVYKRYEIGADSHDGCIGFRLVLSEMPFPAA